MGSLFMGLDPADGRGHNRTAALPETGKVLSMRATMMAVVKEQAKGFGAQWREVPRPDVGPHDVLVQVEKTAICGSDRGRYRWRPGLGTPDFLPSLILGHEMAGRVVEVGAMVTRTRPGDRIAAETHIPCGTCLQCQIGEQHVCHNLKVLGVHRDGCFCEYVSLPEICAVPVPPAMTAEQAVLLEPLGVAYHALSKVKVAGEAVLVVGCGSIGLMAVQLARTLGASLVVAVAKRPSQREMALRLGADLVLGTDPAEVDKSVRAATGGYGADAVIELTGTPDGVGAAFESVRKAGQVVLVGTTKPVMFDFQKYICRKELVVHGQHGRRMFETWRDVMALLGSGRLAVSMAAAANEGSPASRSYPSTSRSRPRSIAAGRQARDLTGWPGR